MEDNKGAKDIYKKFHKLTPDDNIEMGIYEEALDYAFSQDDIRNIVISGSYGAGKSSFLETYKRKNSQRNFLGISLAHFYDGKISMGDDGKNEIRLEGKILNQLLHQIDVSKIPMTNFSIKKEVSENEKKWGTVYITSLTCLIMFLHFRDKWRSLVSRIKLDWLKHILQITTFKEFQLICCIVLLGMCGIGVYYLLNRIAGRKIFRKLSFQGNDIELFSEKEDSFFDKYLNEIIYLFEHAKADAIVFEDMDRFETNQIFERLREINSLLQKRNNNIRFIW